MAVDNIARGMAAKALSEAQGGGSSILGTTKILKLEVTHTEYAGVEPVSVPSTLKYFISEYAWNVAKETYADLFHILGIYDLSFEEGLAVAVEGFNQGSNFAWVQAFVLLANNYEKAFIIDGYIANEDPVMIEYNVNNLLSTELEFEGNNTHLKYISLFGAIHSEVKDVVLTSSVLSIED